MSNDTAKKSSWTREGSKEKTLSDLIPNKEAVATRLEGWFPELKKNVVADLCEYHAELMRVGKALNLIAPSTVVKAESIHFADSLLASNLIFKSLVAKQAVYDVGSGNGFPGLVMAITHRDTKFVLVERDTRKVEFLKLVVAKLKLDNVRVEPISFEQIQPNSVHNLVSRGFAPITKALLVARRPMAKGGRFFHLKGDSWSTELAGVPSQVFSVWTPSLLGQYKVPDINAEMAVVLTEKISD